MKRILISCVALAAFAAPAFAGNRTAEVTVGWNTPYQPLAI